MKLKKLNRLFLVTLAAILIGLLIMPAGPLRAAKDATSLVIATATTGGTYYPMGVGMASLWSIRLAKDHGIMVQAITSAGSGENVNMLRGKEVDLAILQGLFGKSVWNGLGNYKGKELKTIRSITMLWPNVEHFVILGDKVKTGTPTDIKGLRFSIGRAGSGTERSGLTIMSALGMSRDSVKGEYLGYFESAKAMKDKRISGANIPAGPPVAAITDLFATPGLKIKVLEFTDEQLDTINRETAYPGYRYVIKAGTYPGQKADIRTIAQPNLLVVREDISEDVVYLLTKTLFDNPDFLKNVHKMGAFITKENALSGLPAPLHPGAMKYYQEAGLTIPPELVPPGK
jgi:TRAP transporter TAXI family solute receptor